MTFVTFFLIQYMGLVFIPFLEIGVLITYEIINEYFISLDED